MASTYEEQGTGADSIPDQIMKYKNLLDCGAITQSEFEEVKKRLLK